MTLQPRWLMAHSPLPKRARYASTCCILLAPRNLYILVQVSRWAWFYCCLKAFYTLCPNLSGQAASPRKHLHILLLTGHECTETWCHLVQERLWVFQASARHFTEGIYCELHSLCILTLFFFSETMQSPRLVPIFILWHTFRGVLFCQFSCWDAQGCPIIQVVVSSRRVLHLWVILTKPYTVYSFPSRQQFSLDLTKSFQLVHIPDSTGNQHSLLC